MYPAKKENILLMLHELQLKSKHNYLSKDDLKFVSDSINLSYGFVYGVATYYGMFSLIPRGKYTIKLCKSPVCHMLGSITLFDYICNILALENGCSTTKDGLFTLETVECLGHCDKAPCLLLNEEIYGNLTMDKVNKIIVNHRSNS